MTTSELCNEMREHAQELRFIANHSNPGAECPEADALENAADLLARSAGKPA